MAHSFSGSAFPGAVGGMAMSLPAVKRPRLLDSQSSGVVSGASSMDENFSDDEDQSMRGKGGSKLSTEAKRFQHCEVEKRRRERMNRYMAELAQMIPACSAVPRRLDKLSILKMAVDHMKNLRGDPHTSSDYKPSFLTDSELKQLVVEAANGFLMIIECSQARVLFVSDAIQEVLQESVEGWMGTCFYDLLHPKDIQKVKEQLACFDVEEALKASVRQNVSNSPLIMHTQSMNGLRRSFLCRVKRSQRQTNPDSSQSELAGRDFNRSEDMICLLQSTQQCIPYEYAVLHCTGYIRNLTSTERQTLCMKESSSGTCLVAVARLQQFGDSTPRATMESNENEFVARVGVDGRFTYVDPRIAGVLGYLPQDLIGQVSYEYFHPEDIQKMVQLHHDAMKRRTPMPTVQYRFLSKSQKWVWLAMKAFSFINPFSQQVEYVVCTNVILRSSEGSDTGEEVGGGASVVRRQPPSLVSQDSDKQERIERYVRMTISNQVEQQLLGQQSQLAEDDPLASLMCGMGDIPSLSTAPPVSSALPNPLQTVTASQPHTSSSIPPTVSVPSTAYSVTSSHSHTSIPPPGPYVGQALGGPVLSSPAGTTFEENAATAQRILEEYNKLNITPPHRKDLGYGFPSGLFSADVDLEGSQQAYHMLLQGLDNPEDFQQIFNQIEADPFRPQNIFGDMDFDVFD